MEGITDQVQCRTKSDSTVMRILRCAMDERHEKLQSRGGLFEFLHDRATFYELAAVLVEGGLNIVREETDGNSDNILSDLVEIKKWLEGRIEELNELIVEKDKELMERLENELKLQQTLELKDAEIVRLQEKLMKYEDVLKPDRPIQEGLSEEDILKLKTSDDQQMGFMKKQLEDEVKSPVLDRRTRKHHTSSPNLSFDFLDKESNESPALCKHGSFIFEGTNAKSQPSRPVQKHTLIKRMSSDIGSLKDILDLAFGKMQEAEVLPLEKEWRWNIEKDVASVFLQGVVRDIRKSSIEVEGLREEVEKAKNERDSLKYTYQFLARTMVEDVCGLSCNKQMDIEDGSFGVFDELKSALNQIVQHCLESTVREDIYMIFVREKSEQLKRIAEEQFRKEHPAKFTSIQETSFDAATFDYTLMESTMSLMKEDIYMVYFRDMIESWMLETNDRGIESLVRENTNDFIIGEAVRDLCINLSKAQAARQLCIQDRTPRSLNLDFQGSTPPRSRKFDADGEDILIQKIDSLSKCLDAEEDLMLKASCEIQEHNVNNSLVILNCEENEERDVIKWLITDDESTFTSVSHKLERALQQVYTSKELLVELEQSLEEPGDEAGEHDDIRELVSPNDILGITMQFQLMFEDFDCAVREKLERNRSRLEELKCRINTATEGAALPRKRKLVYKKAFISTSHNLKLAETEVDLLGNQVDDLLCLLHRIHIELHKNAAALSRHFEVYEILKLIKGELGNRGPS
ncbi:WPP domain-associated protein [Andrographis paniculata]|uniref:WPP domain-associated protein n=1 Tax=Andrographis paniculata TaxID=175694 RepID=UPI0021E79682|nr:WPP domain-associated protein [Andrographis paniculata]